MHLHHTVIYLTLLISANLASQAEKYTEVASRGCQELGKCCQGKNSTCSVHNRVEIVNGPSEWKQCFCDAECVVTGDCCPDHREFCKPVDCSVSDWSDWSECSLLCGAGNRTRTRTVTQEATNGGATCPVVIQMRHCVGGKCNVKRDLNKQTLKETGRILPIRYAMYRTSTTYDIRKGIRKNLYEHYLSENSILSKPTYCAFYDITYSRPHCSRPVYGEWAKALTRGARICVECQSSAMHENGHCKGDGVPSRATRWKAVGVSSCSGWWRLDAKPKECSCNSRKDTSLIFV